MARSEAIDGLFDEVDKKGTLQVLTSALEQLGQPRSEILRLRFFEGLEPTRIAERMGMSPGTVRSHIYRGLANLRSEGYDVCTVSNAELEKAEGGVSCKSIIVTVAP